MTRLWAGQPRKFGSTSGKGKTFFSKIFRLLLMPTQPPSQLLLGALSPWAKGNASDHPHLLCAKVKKKWIYTPSSIRLHAIHTDNGLFVWQIIYNRQTDGNRQRERRHSCTTARTLIHYQFPLLTSTPCHKEYSSEEIQRAAKKITIQKKTASQQIKK